MSDAVYMLAAALVGLTLFKWPKRDSRLQGTWRSNKEETVARWKREGTFSPEVIARLETILGKTSFTITGRTVTQINEGQTQTGKLTVLRSTKEYAVYEIFSEAFKRHMRFVAFFVEDGFWSASDDPIKGYIEKFDKL